MDVGVGRGGRKSIIGMNWYEWRLIGQYGAGTGTGGRLNRNGRLTNVRELELSAVGRGNGDEWVRMGTYGAGTGGGWGRALGGRLNEYEW